MGLRALEEGDWMSLAVHSLLRGRRFLKDQGFVVKEAMGDTGEPGKTFHRKRTSFLLLLLLPAGFLLFTLFFYSMEIEPRPFCRLGKHSPGILLLF